MSEFFNPLVVSQFIVMLTTLGFSLAAFLKAKAAEISSQSAKVTIEDNSEKLDTNNKLTAEIHTATNGKMDALLKAVQSAAAAAASAAEAAQRHAERQDLVVA